MAKKRIADAVAKPSNVIMFCPDFHSCFIVSNVTIESRYAKTIHVATKEKKRSRFWNNRQVKKIQPPTMRTAIC